MNPRIRSVAQSWAIPLLMLVVWELATRTGALDARFFVPVTEIFATMIDQLANGRLGADILVTLQRLALSFGLAAVCGVAIGVASGLWRTFELLIRPVTDTLYPLPKIAVLPLFIIIVGRGELAFVLTAFATAFFQIIISTRGSVRAIDGQLIEAARNFGATGRRYVTRFLLPAIAPALLDGLRLGMATCLITLIATEFVGAESGIGSMIRRAGQQFALDEVYAGLVLTGLLGLAITGAFRLIQPLALPWRRGSAGRARRVPAVAGA